VMYRTLKPKLDMSIKPMSNLSKETQERICSCDVMCKQYVHIDDYGRFCAHDAKEIGLSLFSLVEGIHRVESYNKRYGWNVQEEQFIIEWYERRGGGIYGDRRVIATMLNRPYENVASKIARMRKEGKL